METNIWYDLDSDNNKKDPEKGMFCCRCKRPIKQTQCFETFTSVEVHPYHSNLVRKSALRGNHLIGSECEKKITKISEETLLRLKL